MDQSSAIFTCIPVPLVFDIIFKSKFFHFHEIPRDLPPVIESSISRMRMSKLRQMDLAWILFTVHAKINSFLFISTYPDSAAPFTGPLLFPFFRSTSIAGFLIRGTGATPYPTGCQFSRNLSFQDPGFRDNKINNNMG